MLKGPITAQIVLIVLTLLVPWPLVSIMVDFRPGQSAFLSWLCFGIFYVTLFAKLLAQTVALLKIRKAVRGKDLAQYPLVPELLHKYSYSYVWYFIFHLLFLAGLIPVIHLLAVWAIVSVGYLGLGIYAERKFFIEIPATLGTPQGAVAFPLVSATFVAFYIAVPLLLPAIWFGLSALLG